MATYVLIPGAGGDAWYWHLLVPELRERGLEAVAVDLPADDDSAGLSRTSRHLPRGRRWSLRPSPPGMGPPNEDQPRQGGRRC